MALSLSLFVVPCRYYYNFLRFLLFVIFIFLFSLARDFYFKVNRGCEATSSLHLLLLLLALGMVV